MNLDLVEASDFLSDEPLHLAEAGHLGNLVRVEEHDVFLLELLNLVDMSYREGGNVRVDKHGHLAAKLLQLLNRELELVEGTIDHLRVHLLANLDDDAELVE